MFIKEVFQIAEERSIPLLIHNNTWDNNYGKAYFKIFEKEFLNTFDSLTIIFAHLGGGGGFFQFGYDFLKEFSIFYRKNDKRKKHKIYFELSGAVNKTIYSKEKTNTELLHLMTEIGFDKFHFSSDFQ